MADFTFSQANPFPDISTDKGRLQESDSSASEVLVMSPYILASDLIGRIHIYIF